MSFKLPEPSSGLKQLAEKISEMQEAVHIVSRITDAGGDYFGMPAARAVEKAVEAILGTARFEEYRLTIPEAQEGLDKFKTHLGTIAKFFEQISSVDEVRRVLNEKPVSILNDFLQPHKRSDNAWEHLQALIGEFKEAAKEATQPQMAADLLAFKTALDRELSRAGLIEK